MLIAGPLVLSCTGLDSGPGLLTAERPRHLEEHLAAATIERSELSEDIPEPVEWRFENPPSHQQCRIDLT